MAAARARFPALGDGRAWLDGAAGTQVPDAVIDAVTAVYRSGLGNQGAAFATSHRLDGLVGAARRAVADLVGVPDPAGVVFGPSTTALTYRFAGALAAGWRPGDEVVLTELDHEANVGPWAHAAERAGAVVRMAPLDRLSGTLRVETVTGLLNRRTRLVAVTAASNLLSTMPDVPAIAAAARAVGAVTYVDGAHHCPHAVVDLPAMAADLYVTSAYKWYGPHLAAVVARDPGLLDGLEVENLRPVTGPGPARFELGTNPFPALAGVAAAVDHLAGLARGGAGGRRERLVRSMGEVVRHERGLAGELLAGLREVPGLSPLPGWDVPADRRAPTVSFRLAGWPPAALAAELDRAGVNVWHGTAYALGAAEALGIAESGGAVRASVNLYNDTSDVSRVVEAVRKCATGRGPG